MRSHSVLRTACVTLLLALGIGVLTGCAGGGDADRDQRPAAVSTKRAELGACRALTPADIAKSTNDTSAVPCTRAHTAQTFAVGTFPRAVASKGLDSAALGAYVYDHCQGRFQSFLGGTESLVLRSTLTWAWFRSTTAAWEAGSRTWRCDVVGGGDGSAAFQPLPASARGLLKGRPDDRWMVCVDGPTVRGSAKIPCTRPHTWRAVTTIVLGQPGDPYPGDRLSQVRTRDYCHDSVGAWLNYPVEYDYGYTWFHAAEWKTGNRRSVCWARTVQ